MKLENTVTFTISLPHCSQILKLRPQDIDNILFPNSYKQRVWLPQSMGDCVWLWYEFENIEEKNNYMLHLKSILNEEFLHNIIAENIDQKELDYWIKDDTHKNISFDFLTGFKTSRD